MTQVKFCKDCRWHTRYPRHGDYCTRPIKGNLCVVVGKIEVWALNHHCSNERKECDLLDKCGPEAKYFEKRLSWWERLKEKMK
jgi:hypothetical protein